MHPIEATRIPIDAPRPPRPDMYAVVWFNHGRWFGEVLKDGTSQAEATQYAMKLPEYDYRRTHISLVRIPADPQPVTPPAPSDWRQACKVVKCSPKGWDVISPDEKHFLCGDPGDEWCEINKETHLKYGIFATEEIARSALSIAPVPPGVGQ